MSEYTPKNEWHPTIRQFDINEIVEGGETGLDNIPHQQLADCVFYLLGRLAQAEENIGAILQGVTPDITPNPDDGEPPLPDTNPVGTWTVEGFSKVHALATYTLLSVTLLHSSAQQITGIQISNRQIRASDGHVGASSSSTNSDGSAFTTDANGRIKISFYIRNRPDSWPEMDIKVEAPNTTTLEQRLYIWDGQPANLGGGSGGNANQTE